MNNKQWGTHFERQLCSKLSQHGWWVHFINPDGTGAQPFDIIACKHGVPIAIECKTSVDHIFRSDRLEWNQVMAFNKWLEKGNGQPVLMVLYDDRVKMVQYLSLKQSGGRIDLNDCQDYSSDGLEALVENDAYRGR